MAPFVRFGYEWASLLNTDYMWIWQRGIAGYAEDSATDSDRILRFLYKPWASIAAMSAALNDFV